MTFPGILFIRGRSEKLNLGYRIYRREKNMDYKKGNKVADFISKNHGSYWLGCQSITNNRLYYNKMSHKDKYSIAPENLQNKQSNLVNLLPYIQKMQQDKLN